MSVRSRTWVFLLVGIVALFYWKIIFTKQFSILWQWEPVTQSYSWYHFAASQIHQGVLPIWDPYRFSGSTFIGEMQTGFFYPLKFLAYVMPFDSNGMLSERVYNQFYVLTHILAAIFMFLLARHLRLSSFSSFIAGLSFSLGGYLANTGHPHTLDSGIWLPLIVLFFLKAVDEASPMRSTFFAAVGGCGLGMAVLGGGIHMVIMDGIVIGTMAFVLCRTGPRPMRIFAIAGIIAAAGFLFGAIQLLPSMEYSPLSFRWVGSDTPIRALQKVPYQYLGGFSPRSLFTFLFAAANPGDFAPSNYFGVLPLFLSIVGAWRSWQQRWVKYFAILAVASFLYSWGSFSFLHGLLYLLPGLDIAREAGRFILLTHFAMALLAAYGIEHLFGTTAASTDRIWKFVRVLRWLVIFLAALLIAGSVQYTIDIDDWFFLSSFFIASAYVLIELACRNYRSVPIRAAFVFFLLWDLYEFNWIIRNKGMVQAENQDHMDELLKSRKLAEFFQSRGSLFRVHFDADFPPNIGDAYGIEMTGGMSATMLMDYLGALGHPKMAQLLNVRYTLRRSDLPDRNPVFRDGVWRVYENSDVGERAWVVHQVEINPSGERPLKRLNDDNFDPARVAILERPPADPIDPQPESQGSHVEDIRIQPNSMQLRVKTKGRGLLVASEIFYPGWQAFVNGHSAPIYRVDGFLRGVAVPDGDSAVRFEYRPLSVRLGLILTLFASLGTAALGVLAFRSGSMRREWDKRARQNAKHYVATSQQEWTDEEFFRSGAAEAHELVEKHLGTICNGSPAAQMRALEIGCGAGRMTLALSRIFGQVDAVDVSPEMIAQGRDALGDRMNVRFHVNNGVDLTMFADSSFDFAFSAIVFQHIPKRAVVENYIREAWRVLRPGSIFKFQVQGHPIKEQEADTWIGVGFSEDQMREIASRTGFQIQDSHGAGTQYYWLTFLKP